MLSVGLNVEVVDVYVVLKREPNIKKEKNAGLYKSCKRLL